MKITSPGHFEISKIRTITLRAQTEIAIPKNKFQNASPPRVFEVETSSLVVMLKISEYENLKHLIDFWPPEIFTGLSFLVSQTKEIENFQVSMT